MYKLANENVTNDEDLAKALTIQEDHYGRKVITLLSDLHSLCERTYYGRYEVMDELIEFQDVIEQAELTTRQAQAVTGMTDGYKQTEIAEMLGVSQQAVSQHFNAAVRKLSQAYKQKELLTT